MDGVPGDLIDGVENLSQSVAVTFPAIAPYAGAVGFAAPALLKLVDHLDDHDVILDKRLKLERRDPGTGHNLLQPGYFVCFATPVESGLSLDANLTVRDATDHEFDGLSYAVVGVSRTTERFREVEIDQKVAKLLAELGGKGQSAQAAIYFLRETLSGYTNFRKLQRITELQGKDRTAEEDELLQELLEDEAISDYASE